MHQEAKFVNGHYQLPLPLKDSSYQLPNNKEQVRIRTRSLKKRFTKNPKVLPDYTTFINGMLEKGKGTCSRS